MCHRHSNSGILPHLYIYTHFPVENHFGCCILFGAIKRLSGSEKHAEMLPKCYLKRQESTSLNTRVSAVTNVSVHISIGNFIYISRCLLVCGILKITHNNQVSFRFAGLMNDWLPEWDFAVSCFQFVCIIKTLWII